MTKAIYSIGADNDTGILDTDTITRIISEYFQGFTYMEVVGFWNGKKERSLRVEIVDVKIVSDDGIVALEDLARKLAQELKQDAVMLELSDANVKFIT